MRPSNLILIFLLLILWQRMPWLADAVSSGIAWSLGQTALLAAVAAGIVVHRIHRSVT
ncbi:hypothetical protein ACIOUE_00920 [Streptomyces xanthochromogenes]|uniref:hypothetical protein n=1 Tax=Streptomyces xanthochromogenes TaxID=67384 RepID=UPI0037FFCA35